MNNINMKVESINRITHMGAVRATEARIQSGIALQTEFQLLNARLGEKLITYKTQKNKSGTIC